MFFAEVERFFDTPVKRYSSGMYVRLACAVAVHLEPEILIVDELLAVGDAAFQKKSLGKMREVSGTQGRTVLFVTTICGNRCGKGCVRPGRLPAPAFQGYLVPDVLWKFALLGWLSPQVHRRVNPSNGEVVLYCSPRNLKQE